jgi:hypothetical protein
MGMFTRDKRQQDGGAARAAVMPLGGGRRLRSDLSPGHCVQVLRQVFDGYRPRRRPDMEPLVPTGIRWMAADGAPSIAVSGSDESDNFVLFTLAPAGRGTEAGIFPLRDGNLAVAGHWKQRDHSLTSVGSWPSGTVCLTPPPVDESLVYGTLHTAGYPVTPGNVAKMAQQFTMLFLVRCQEFVSSREGARGADRFMTTHQRWQQQGFPSLADLLQAPLRLLTEWEPAVLPYVQDLPVRIRSILLARAGDGEGSVWSELER